MTRIQFNTNQKPECLLLAGPLKTFSELKSLRDSEFKYIQRKAKAKEYFFSINRLDSMVIIQLTEEFDNKNEYARLEALRVCGHKACSLANAQKYDTLSIIDLQGDESGSIAMAEGAALGNYQFIHYRKDQDKIKNSVQKITLEKHISGKAVEHLNILVEAVYQARNWVNEPQNTLDAVHFAESMSKSAKKAGIKTEVLNKKQMEALKMGGILAVNQGSKTPPTFTILEYKPSKAINKKPIVLVGKGVVYDTGGLSLKPTPNSMDSMKCDMAGGACVAAAITAIAQMQLAVHVIALIPATDNRPGENAYTPGDVIRLYDGQSVEVLNTDAEGRLLLGDALAYAAKYKPELVVDVATLTGAAAAAIGQYGIVCMGTADETMKAALKESGNRVHERLVEFPFWDEYAALIKSDIADMKNIGGPIAGAITAGKFLEKFTDYPWMHFDIAGPAFINSNDSYRGKHGTGTGVRLFIDFIKQYAAK